MSRLLLLFLCYRFLGTVVSGVACRVSVDHPDWKCHGTACLLSVSPEALNLSCVDSATMKCHATATGELCVCTGENCNDPEKHPKYDQTTRQILLSSPHRHKRGVTETTTITTSGTTDVIKGKKYDFSPVGFSIMFLCFAGGLLIGGAAMFLLLRCKAKKQKPNVPLDAPGGASAAVGGATNKTYTEDDLKELKKKWVKNFVGREATKQNIRALNEDIDNSLPRSKKGDKVHTNATKEDQGFATDATKEKDPSSLKANQETNYHLSTISNINNEGAAAGEKTQMSVMPKTTMDEPQQVKQAAANNDRSTKTKKRAACPPSNPDLTQHLSTVIDRTQMNGTNATIEVERSGGLADAKATSDKTVNVTLPGSTEKMEAQT